MTPRRRSSLRFQLRSCCAASSLRHPWLRSSVRASSASCLPRTTLSHKSSALNRCGRFAVARSPLVILSLSKGVECLPDLAFDLNGDIGMLLEEALGVFAALADALLSVGVPGAALADDVLIERDVEDRSHLRDAVTVGDVELGLPEWWSAFILDDFDARARSDAVLADLDRFELANVEPNGCIEFQRAAARRRFGISEHDADLFAELVDEDHHGFAARDRGGQLAQRLGHQSGL